MGEVYIFWVCLIPTRNGVTGIKLLCSREREMSTGYPALPEASGWVGLTFDYLSRSPQMDQSLIMKGTGHSLVLVYSLGFPLQEHQCGTERIREDHAFLRTFTTQRPNHKSFEDSKSPSINSSWPWIQPWAHNSVIHWWGIFGYSKDERRCCSQSSLGSVLITPFYFVYKKPWARQFIYFNIYSALLESEHRHYQILPEGFWSGQAPE